MLTRRKESDPYLATVSRHRWSVQIAMKVDKICSFQSALRPSSAEEVSLPLELMKATVLTESYYILSILIVTYGLQRCLLTVAR